MASCKLMVCSKTDFVALDLPTLGGWGRRFRAMSYSFPQSDRFKCLSEAYQAFEKPLPRGHGSVESVR